MPKKKLLHMGFSGYPVINLTAEDARIVKGMLSRGDRQHDIAAYFGVNHREVSDVANGHLFGYVAVAQRRFLPTPGPYIYEDIRKDNKNLLLRVEALLKENKLAAAQSLIETALESI